MSESKAESKVETDAHKLKEALGKRIGSDKKAIIQVLGKMTNAHSQAVHNFYNTTFSRSLHTDIKNKLSSDLEDLAIALLTEVNEYDAKCLRRAFSGMGSNKDLITEIICTRNDEEIKSIATAYNRLYQEELKARVHSESSGNLRKMYETLLVPRATSPTTSIDALVEALYQAGEKKLGTDEKVFIDILCGHSREVVTQIAEAYHKAHGKTLYKVIGSEFSFHQKKSLQALVQPIDQYYADILLDAFNRMNVNEATIIRVFRGRKEKELSQISQHLATLKKTKPLLSWVCDKMGGNLKTCLTMVSANFAGHAALA